MMLRASVDASWAARGDTCLRQNVRTIGADRQQKKNKKIKQPIQPQEQQRTINLRLLPRPPAAAEHAVTTYWSAKFGSPAVLRDRRRHVVRRRTPPWGHNR